MYNVETEHEVIVDEHELAVDAAERSICQQLGEYTPEVRLLIEVMISAVKDKDYNYFIGPAFLQHCKLLELDHNFLLSNILTKQFDKENFICYTYLDGKINLLSAKDV